MQGSGENAVRYVVQAMVYAVSFIFNRGQQRREHGWLMSSVVSSETNDTRRVRTTRKQKRKRLTLTLGVLWLDGDRRVSSGRI